MLNLSLILEISEGLEKEQNRFLRFLEKFLQNFVFFGREERIMDNNLDMDFLYKQDKKSNYKLIFER